MDWAALGRECVESRPFPDYQEAMMGFQAELPTLLEATFQSDILEDHLARAILTHDDLERGEAVDYVLSQDPGHIGALYMAQDMCVNDSGFPFCSDDLWTRGLSANPTVMESYFAAILAAGGTDAPIDLVEELLVQADAHIATAEIGFGYYSAISGNAYLDLIGGSEHLYSILVAALSQQTAMMVRPHLHELCPRFMSESAGAQACLNLARRAMSHSQTAMAILLAAATVQEMQDAHPGLVDADFAEHAGRAEETTRTLIAKAELGVCLLHKSELAWFIDVMEMGEVEAMRSIVARLDEHLVGETATEQVIRDAIARGGIGESVSHLSEDSPKGDQQSVVFPDGGLSKSLGGRSNFLPVGAVLAFVGLVALFLIRRGK